MSDRKSLLAVLYALLAAVFFALNTPFSKVLLQDVSPTFMAGCLYMGAGIGVGIMYLFKVGEETKEERLSKCDMPYTIGMIVLDILAPIFLMIGIDIGSASNASLLGNFEIVATTMIALAIFKEKVSSKLWIAIGFITLSSVLLSLDGGESFEFSYGSIFVLLSTLCWGLENNCTRMISDKSTYQIVMIKGIFSGSGAFLISIFIGESIPEIKYILYSMFLGFIAYGISIFLYIRAQRDLGAAKTSAYYAVTPFIGAFLSFLINGESLSWIYFLSLIFMIIGSIYVVLDTLLMNHAHAHLHEIAHVHGGFKMHSHLLNHEHYHNHILNRDIHYHRHKEDFINSEEHLKMHEENDILVND